MVQYTAMPTRARAHRRVHDPRHARALDRQGRRRAERRRGAGAAALGM